MEDNWSGFELLILKVECMLVDCVLNFVESTHPLLPTLVIVSLLPV